MVDSDYARGRRGRRAKSLSPGKDVALATEAGERIAILKLTEIYKVDRQQEAEAVFGTAEDAHPGAKNVTSTPSFCLGGKVILFADIPGRTFLEYRLDPRADAGEVPRARLAQNRRLPDPQSDPSRARVYPEGRA